MLMCLQISLTPQNNYPNSFNILNYATGGCLEIITAAVLYLNRALGGGSQHKIRKFIFEVVAPLILHINSVKTAGQTDHPTHFVLLRW